MWRVCDDNYEACARSFSCRYAKTPDEILICQNTDLSALEEGMSSIFFQLLNTLSDRKIRMLDEEQALCYANAYPAEGTLIASLMLTRGAFGNSMRAACCD
jgi:hypothetical protein